MVSAMASDLTAVDPQPQQHYVASIDDVRELFAASQQRVLFEQAVEHHHGSALKSCTYSAGYIQQPLFSCITCRGGTGDEGDGRDVALCAACAFKCHSDHELEEIYEKRHTRCDCPTLTSRPPAPPTPTPTPTPPSDPPSPHPRCILNPAATATVQYPPNAANAYNHNYVGRYCHCDGRYDAAAEAMYQCDLCYDWFHERCMTMEAGARVPREAEEGLLACRACVKESKYDFLLPYLLKARLRRAADETKEEGGQENVLHAAPVEDAAQVDLFPEITAKQKQQAASALVTESTAAATLGEELPGWQCAHCHYFNQPHADECFGCEKPRKTDTTDTAAPKPVAPNNVAVIATLPPAATCTRPTRIPASFSRVTPPDLWVQSSYLSALCNCDDCLSLYTTRAPFLLSTDSDSDSDTDPTATASRTADSTHQPDLDDAVHSADELMDGYLDSLPRHAVLEGMGAMAEWNEAVVRRLQALGGGGGGEGGGGEGVVITGEMVRAVAEEAREEVEAKRRRRREAVDELDGAEEDDPTSSKRGRFEE